MADPMQQARELRPCPFCGGEAERIDFGPGAGENEGGSCIACKRCQASGPVEFGFKENFIANWNRRAAPEGYVLVPVEPTREMMDAGRTAVMAARIATMKWTPRQHYEASGRSMAGIPEDVLDERGPLTKESVAVMVFGSMVAHRPQGVK